MLHEIAPHRFDNAFTNREPEADDYALLYREHGVVYLREGDSYRFPRISEIRSEKVMYRYGFAIDEECYFIILGTDVEVDGEVEVLDANAVRNLEPMHLAFAGMLGKQLYRFFGSRRYCGCCGTKTRFSEVEQAVICPECHHTEYPKISPAIIVAIVNDDKLLMTKYAYGDYQKYALVAGFVEFGESFEEAVVREVQEEVGLKVKNVRYYKNQPWPFSDSQMVGFFAELDGDDTVTIQEEELSEAVWFSREQIPENKSAISISHELIEAVRSGEAKAYLNKDI